MAKSRLAFTTHHPLTLYSRAPRRFIHSRRARARRAIEMGSRDNRQKVKTVI